MAIEGSETQGVVSEQLTAENDAGLTYTEKREVCLRWERETGKCSACGHALSMHNELAYCRSKTSHDRSGECICGLPNAENRRLHLTRVIPPGLPDPNEAGS